MKTVRHRLPTGWKGDNGLEQIAETLDAICRMINGIDVVQRGSVFIDKDHIHFRIDDPGSKWSRVYWFGNDRYDLTDTEITGRYLIIDLLDGSHSFTDAVDELDNTQEQAFHVADAIYGNPDDSEEITGYKLNSHTQGDIHARIT